MQNRFDKMNEAQGKTGGGGDYFEPLRYELNDCFGALKNIQPDSVFSSRQGMMVYGENNELETKDDENVESDENQAVATTIETGGPDSKIGKKTEKRQRIKSNKFILYVHKYFNKSCQ